jgi:hypothetical protein
MILTFSKTEFATAIKQGTKIHTIREDKCNRWHPGCFIHFWLHNPRNIKLKPYQFAKGVVSFVCPIEIFPAKDEIYITGHLINDPLLLNKVAINDGFKDWNEMKEFFNADFRGKMIFWQDIQIIK